MSSLQDVSTQAFASEVPLSEVPVLVDFYADWCGPSQILAPTLTNRFQVSAIPDLALIADGKVVSRATGLAGEATLRTAPSQISSVA